VTSLDLEASPPDPSIPSVSGRPRNGPPGSLRPSWPEPSAGRSWPALCSAGAIAVTTAAMVAIGAHRLGGTTPVLSVVAAGWARMLGPVILGFVGAVLVLEQVVPAVRRPLLARGQLHDGLYLILYASVAVPLVVLGDLGVSDLLRREAPWLVLSRLDALPEVALAIAALLVMDASNWAAHWANHRWTPLWRFHAVHHTQEELSVLTSFRAHPLVHASFFVSLIPVLVLTSGAAVPAGVITAYVCLSSLPHANLNWSFGPVGRVVVSPAYHRIHHARRGRDDINLGTVFTFWDVLARRAVFPERHPTPLATGLDGYSIPNERSRPLSRSFWVLAGQLAEPFGPARLLPPAGRCPPVTRHRAGTDPGCRFSVAGPPRRCAHPPVLAAPRRGPLRPVRPPEANRSP
jgi:sterol desaturase/sphingolipid hydroxylase (fatty acid hydroxylase superfamily)